MTTSQNQRIVDYLRGGRKITSLDAWIQFGCSALHSRAADIRKMGLPIKGTWITVDTAYGKKRVMEYSMEVT